MTTEILIYLDSPARIRFTSLAYQLATDQTENQLMRELMGMMANEGDNIIAHLVKVE